MKGDVPTDVTVTFQWQYRKCGKDSCSTCKDGVGHGKYLYAYWREGGVLKSAYAGEKEQRSRICKRCKTQPRLKGKGYCFACYLAYRREMYAERRYCAQQQSRNRHDP